MSEKASKGRFLGPDKLRTHSNEGKGKERKKERKKERERRKKGGELEPSNGCTLSFYNGYFGEKKLLDTKGPFGGDVFKNPARHTGEGKLRKSSKPLEKHTQVTDNFEVKSGNQTYRPC